MPCQKCSNNKYKYGEHGKCVFDTLAACKRAAAAIHIEDKSMQSAEVLYKDNSQDTKVQSDSRWDPS